MGKGKFYAVRVGHHPGIYDSWEACKQAVEHYSGAAYKSFKTRQEAEAYLQDGNSPAAAAAATAPLARAAAEPRPRSAAATAAAPGTAVPGIRSGQGKYYVIVRGHKTGIFQLPWAEVQPLMNGFSQPVVKAFSSEADAFDYWNSLCNSQPTKASSPAGTKRKRAEADRPLPPPAFNAKAVNAEMGTLHMPGSAAAAAAGQQRCIAHSAGNSAPPQIGLGIGGQLATEAAAGVGQGGATATGVSGTLLVDIFFDGGARGNPGRAGYGYVIFDRRTRDRLQMGCRPLPYNSTNNEAEYSGLIAGLRCAVDILGAEHVVVRGDSELVVRHMNGIYKVKSDTLLPLFREAQMLRARCQSFEIWHVYREENTLADELSNLAMDTDAVVDRIAAAAADGADRGQLAAMLARAAKVDQQPEVVDSLRTAPCFLTAVSHLLRWLWDNMGQEEVIAWLQDRGWDETTGGPPVPPLGLPGAAMPAAAADPSGRGMHTVAVAAVSLGPAGWAQEIQRQEALQQQLLQQRLQGHQQQQQNQAQAVQQHCQHMGGLVYVSGKSDGHIVAGHRDGSVRRIRCCSNMCSNSFGACQAVSRVHCLDANSWHRHHNCGCTHAGRQPVAATVKGCYQQQRQPRAVQQQLQQQQQQRHRLSSSSRCQELQLDQIQDAGQSMPARLPQHAVLLPALLRDGNSELLRAAGGGSQRAKAARMLVTAAAVAVGRLSRGQGNATSTAVDKTRAYAELVV